MFPEYDVIVVGGGHAGCEAAAASARMGSRVLLITMNMQTIAQMSCNPAMGGVAKGQIVREIDAMGGFSGIVTDRTMVQFRMLNRSKGPAMWSPRAQSDRMLFAAEWRNILESLENIDFWQDMVSGIIVNKGRVSGVTTSMGHQITGKTVVLTNGTFLNGLIHIGAKNFGGGRAGEKASSGITEQLKELGFEAGRMKTGTPPRVDGRSLDYSVMEEQEGENVEYAFSYVERPSLKKQKSCYITYTNQSVHDELRKGFDQSPMFNGRIKGLGPRYCPSIEDKIDRFADRDRHQIFVEPEGWNTVETYINGFSTSLPEDIQYKAIRKIRGFENAKLFRPGYAIEYDYFPPNQLNTNLETRLINGLFFAGQINGTTGYEEAACQGLMAGINASLKTQDHPPLILDRSQAYIGVLIDDLIFKSTKEPYRMFTSRAEYRILLRQDNADIRLTELASTIGLVDQHRVQRVKEKIKGIEEISTFLENLSLSPEDINTLLEKKESSPIKQKTKAVKILSRPQISLDELKKNVESINDYASNYDSEIQDSAEIQLKYAGYIEKESQVAEKMKRLEDTTIINNFDFHKLQSLSAEAREKLTKFRPSTIGQASRISGVSPADISVLMVYMGR